MLFATTLKVTKADGSGFPNNNTLVALCITLNCGKEDKNKNPLCELLPSPLVLHPAYPTTELSLSHSSLPAITTHTTKGNAVSGW